MFAVPTSLQNSNTTRTLDTAIGGTAPLVRYCRDGNSEDGWEFDFFAVVLSRFSDYNTFNDADFRFGLPVSWANGPWSAKLAYEHTSSHLGDDFIKDHVGGVKSGRVRDEIVAGLSYRWWDQLRLYAQFGYAPILSTPGPNNPDRYDVGLEWSNHAPTGWSGQPYAAIDLELYGDEDYTPDLTIQVGWQWIEPGVRLTSLRLGLEYYNGRSPYGQFFFVHEQWFGVGLFLDF